MDELIVGIGTAVGVGICILLLIGLTIVGRAGAQWVNYRFWLKSNYPNHKSWPTDVRDVVYLPVTVDYFSYPISAILAVPLAVGGILAAIGESVEITALSIVGRAVLFVPSLFFYSLISGSLSGAMMKSPPPQLLRKHRSEKAIRSLKIKCKEGETEMRGLYRLWLTCYRHDKLAQRFGDEGDLKIKYHQFMKGYVLPAMLASKINDAIKKYLGTYNKVLKTGELSNGMNRFLERRIKGLESLSVKITKQDADAVV